MFCVQNQKKTKCHSSGFCVQFMS
uniref:Uncharacterized protein n=1 Tax=Rhizophora mucronata TaxID=61149 RepID=A0A2P2KIY5_RHIMU